MKRRRVSKKILTLITAASLIMQPTAATTVFAAVDNEAGDSVSGGSVSADDKTVSNDDADNEATYSENAAEDDSLKAFYEFDFEDDSVSENIVYNADGLEGTGEAVLGGKKSVVQYDDERGSNVLYLPGGSTSSGYLTLPNDMFESGMDGFTLSFWVKAAADGSSSTHYQRIFESSSSELGQYYQGTTGNWTDPEFTFVVGGGDEADTRYDACINTSDNTKGRLEWGRVLGSGDWDYLTVSVTPESYDVYINGAAVSVTDLAGNEATVLKGFFDEIGDFTHNALGQSVYTSDANAKAYYDDFRFYRRALTAEEAISIYTDEYQGEAEETIDYGDSVALEFDTTDSLGDIFHGSTGFLYGISEVGVPSWDLLSALKPGILVQKAADGMQHPSGDGYRLTDYLKSAGVKNIEIYLQDYYLEWPYDYNGIDDYQEKVESIVSKMVEGKSEEEKAAYSYVLFNEPDNIWYGNSGTKLTSLCEDWKTIYDTVKEIDPNAKTAGPNFASFSSSAYETFFEYCAENDCLPEIITWHDLAKGKLTAFETELSSVKSMIEEYYDGSGIDPMIFVNETVNFEDIGVPGTLVNWLSIYEENDTYASLPYWGLANSLNELAAEENKPNSAWWVYRWYAQMQGYKTSLTTYNVNNPSSAKKGDRLYGLCSVDEDNETVMTLFGGHEGEQNISLKNIGDIDEFADTDAVHLKIYRSRYSGHQGFSIPDVIVDEDRDLSGSDSLMITISDADLMDAYFAVITPSDGNGINGETANWLETYEAEDAELLGTAAAYTRTGGSDLARSGRADVAGIYSESDGVRFSVDVPSDGVYTARIYYSSAAPYVNATSLEIDADGQNRAIGQVVEHRLEVDDDESTEQILTYASTVKSGYYNYAEAELELTEGEHEIEITHYGASQKDITASIRLAASIDKLDLYYEGSEKENAKADIPFEENFNEDYHTEHSLSGYIGNGYSKGAGSVELLAAVPEDGLYDTELIYALSGNAAVSISKKSFDYGEDATAEAELAVNDIELSEITLDSTDGNFETAGFGKIYLKAGVNMLTINSDSEICLDELSFVKDESATEGASITLEAEMGTTGGNAEVITNDYASGSRMVDGIGGGDDESILTMEIEAPEEGTYALSMFYANDEPAPVMLTSSGEEYVHPYNTDLVERYAQISVNDSEAETVYFRNTFCWDVIRNQFLDVKLNAGKNKIVFSNDNSYKFSEIQDDYAPRFDKFMITPLYLDADYEVSIDRTALYKAIVKASAYYELNYTKGSFAELQKAIEEAEDIYEEGITDEETISSMIDSLGDAENALVSLVSIRKTVSSVTAYSEADYTVNSWKKLIKTVETAEELIEEENVTAEELKTAEEAIKDAIAALQDKYPLIDNSSGTITSDANEASHPEYAWNGDSSTYPDLVDDNGAWNSSSAWTQIAFPEAVTISKIRFANRSGYLDRLIGGEFYGSNNGEDYDLLYTVEEVTEGYNTILFDEPVRYSYIRYNSPAGCYLNIADIRLYGLAIEDDTETVSEDEAEKTPETVSEDEVEKTPETVSEDEAEKTPETVSEDETEKNSETVSQDNTPKAPENNLITDDTENALLTVGNIYKIKMSFNVKKYLLDRSEKKIIKVTKKGKVKVKKSGTVTLEILGKNGESKTITIYAEKPKAVKKTAAVGEVFDAAELVSGVTYLTPVSYKSGNNSVAVVDENGKVTAMKKGTVRIIISFGNKKATVKAKLKVRS
ncbi:MAG: FIVAR domain-containing protein [Lachnospiraceae bacterium]|nr:FIVAR domain-containing protein [Lachnospiraceae bacterium]